MKKHRRFTKQISDGFLERKALTYWRNLIANYDESVSDRDFFDYFARCDASGEAIRKIRALYTKEQLEEIGYGIARHVASGNVAEALHELWNDRGHRRKTREIVLSVVDRRLSEIKDRGKGETENRLDYVGRVFGFDEVEKELLAFAFVFDLFLVEDDGDKTPLLDGGEGALVDPWDNDYQIEIRNKHYAIISSGPDGEIGTEDDIRSDTTAKSGRTKESDKSKELWRVDVYSNVEGPESK